jgi:hypothetical protein
MNRLTDAQAAVISAYTGVLCCKFDVLHAYVEKIMGRPVFTHEFAFAASEIKEAAKDDFMDLIGAPND